LLVIFEQIHVQQALFLLFKQSLTFFQGVYMKIQPLHDRILVQPILEKEVRKSGIIIPDSAKEKPIEGRVKAVGKGKVGDDGKPVKLEVKVGDKVLYSKYGGTEIKFEGEDFLLMREDDVLAIVG
jgi:chaperonin GroES